MNTSGIFTVLSGMVTASIYILGAGGGAARIYTAAGGGREKVVRGGGGGEQTIVMNLVPNVYEIIIGVGGAYASGTFTTTAITKTGKEGGYTVGFGAISTGGKGGTVTWTTSASYSGSDGSGGNPNGVTGGGNGGNLSAGGDGYVELTFS